MAKKLLFLLAIIIGIPSLHLFSETTSSSNPYNLTETTAAPDPLNLSPNWWSYYNVDGELLQARVNESIEQYEKLASSLPEETYNKAGPLIERIISSLQTLPEFKGKIAIPPLPKQEFRKKYSFVEFVQLARGLQENEQELKIFILQYHLSKESLQSGYQYLDTLVAAYIAQSPSSPKRLMNGLEIVAEKLSLTIDEFQQKYLENIVIRQTAVVDETKQEINFARSHLFFPSDAKTSMEKEIADARNNLSKSVANVFQKQLLYTRSYAQKSLSPEQKSLASQALVNATILESVSRILLLESEIQNVIVGLYLNQKEQSPSSIHHQITNWHAQIQKIERLTSDWEESITLEMDRVLKNLSYIENPNSSAEESEGQIYYRLLQQVQETLLSLQRLENEIFVGKFLIDQLDLLMSEKYVTFTDRIIDTWQRFIAYVADHVQWIKESFFKIGSTPITIRAILKVIVILFLGFVLAKFSQKFLLRLGKKHALLNESALYTISRLVYFFFLVLGLFVAITSIGIDFTAFAFVAGAITFWIGFGLLSIIQNFVSGIILLLDKNIKVGDFIVLDSGESGIILDITTRTTLLKTLDGHKILIPNSDLIIKKFTNKSIFEDCYRKSIPFKISYSADREKVKEIVIEAAKNIPYTRSDKDPQIWMMKFCDDNIDLALVVWVNSTLVNKQASSLDSIYLWAIDEALRTHQIPISK